MSLLAPADRQRSTAIPRLRPVAHDLFHGCLERLPCPVHGVLEGGYLPAERLRNGTVVAHDCGRSWLPAAAAVAIVSRGTSE